MANVALEVVRESAKRGAFTGPLAPRDDFQLSKMIDISKCIGCKACQSACLEWNDLREQPIEHNVGVYDNPHDLTEYTWTLMRFTEWDNPQTGKLEWLIRKDGCMHCADPGCLKACPAPGAIVQYSNGIVDFQHDQCIGCGYCIKGCPFNIPRLSKTTEKVYKCTLCVDRVAVGQGPACAKACPTKAITFGAKAEMKALAETRIVDLKSRGFQNAGLYDPPGVGGTHVMYVLQHADQPQIYAGLPKDARISWVVEWWKSKMKYFGFALVGLSTAIGALHYAVLGPNRVTAHDEIEGEKIREGEA
jgi:formate dehydrogenase iron-sulfur subunit